MDQIGKYEIQGELGRGGFGVVYRGWDPAMRRPVAIKVINAVSDPGLIARLRVEGRTTGSLRHQNIVTVYETGEHDSKPYFVMEFLEGRTLRDAVRNGPPLELWEKVGVLLDVAKGIQHAHNSGVVHRDIKPSNVMLVGDGWVKVLDFGIARLMDQSRTQYSTTGGAILGTIEYMAPEQFDGVEPDAATDIFSFGVTCYEVLTGTQPFRASGLAQTVALIARADPAPLDQILPDCPPLLSRVVHKALAKDRSARYRSMRDLLYDLAPVEATLRRNRASECAAAAADLADRDDLEMAESWLQKAIKIDPATARGPEVRIEIDRRRERREEERRIEESVRSADALLAAGDPAAAESAFERVLQSLPPDPADGRRTLVVERLASVRKAIAIGKRIAEILSLARSALQAGELDSAAASAAEIEAIDPSNEGAASLRREIQLETRRLAERDAALRRAAERENAVAETAKAVREHVDAMRFGEASRLLAAALALYPGDLILEGIAAAVDAARRKHEGPAVPPERAAAAPRPAGPPGDRIVVSPVPVGKSPDWESSGDPASVSLGPVTPKPSRRDTGRSRGGVSGAASSAAGPSVRRWRLAVAAALALGALALGTAIIRRQRSPATDSGEPAPQSAEMARIAEVSRLRAAVAQGIRARQWISARADVARLSALEPAEPAIRTWIGQIDAGSARDARIADLRAAVGAAIGRRDWSGADRELRLLLETVPGDPQAVEWQRLLSSGRKEDLLASEAAARRQQTAEIDDLRASIPGLIESRRWADAQQRISKLLSVLPRDAQATAWQNQLYGLRAADLNKTAPASNASTANAGPAPGGRGGAETAGARPVETSSERTGEARPSQPQAPIVAEFSVAPSAIDKGQMAVVRWSVTGASDISIDNGIGTVPPAGSRSVSPAATTTYTLRASGTGGTATASALVSVASPVSAPPAPASAANAGSSGTGSDALSAHIRTIAGNWEYDNPGAPNPKRSRSESTYYPRKVTVSVDESGKGRMFFQVKDGMFSSPSDFVPIGGYIVGAAFVHVPAVTTEFELSAWDGRKLSGKSKKEDYSLTLEPSGASLKLDWLLKGKPSRVPMRLGSGNATLNRQ